jgi:hypothetical protein
MHLAVKLNATFEQFTRQLEDALGTFDPSEHHDSS